MYVWLYALTSFTLYPCTKLLSWAFIWVSLSGWHTPPWAILRQLIVASEGTLTKHFFLQSLPQLSIEGANGTHQWLYGTLSCFLGWNTVHFFLTMYEAAVILIVVLLGLSSNGFPSRMPMTGRYYVHACLAAHSYNGFMKFYFCHRRWSRLRSTEQERNYASCKKFSKTGGVSEVKNLRGEPSTAYLLNQTNNQLQSMYLF